MPLKANGAIYVTELTDRSKIKMLVRSTNGLAGMVVTKLLLMYRY